jgi:hypothetical protein
MTAIAEGEVIHWPREPVPMSLVGDELGGHETVVPSATSVGRILMTLKARSTWIDHKDYQPFVSGWQNSWSW